MEGRIGRKAFIAYMLALTMFTVYILMDTFVITRVYGDEESASASNQEVQVSDTQNENADSSSDAAQAVTSEDTYKDENISVTLKEYRINDTTVYAADVELSSPDYLKTALAQGLYGRNIKQETSGIAEDNNAVLAINGDYYGARESGYVIKNGVLYRDEASAGREDLVIYKDGSCEIISEDEVSAEELMEKGAVQTFSFGPALVDDGSIAVETNEEVGQAMASNPRTAIGIIDENHYVFVVSDGRTDESEGLSLHELADFMKELGCETAYNLDGGGSSTMYFNGNVVNNPTGGGAGHKSGSERSVSDIVYIGYSSQEAV